jgi:hypothetical protein
VFKHARFPLTIAVAAFALVALAPTIASAHEKRQVGNYTFVVGFLSEPPIVDQPNSIDLTVTDSNNQPVTGLEKTLKAQIIYGGSTEDVALTPRFNAPGKYNGYVIPTKTGTWKFHFTGTINGDNVDQTFTSGPNTFGDVQSTDTTQFPVKTGDLLTIGSQASAAKSSADSAKTVGIIGIVVGAIGIVIGLGGVGLALSARRSAPREEAAPGGASLRGTA